VARGKNRSGRIACVISHEGDAFTLTIADDGAGIDVELLRKKAVSIGLMSEEQASALQDDEAMSLIFVDDITVRVRADELSGRGIGLAAVRAAVQALGGNVTVSASPGQGTRFLFTFPSRNDRPLLHVTEQ
jgi:two-component system chemotaxis sensor kinase CheA